MLRLVRDLTPHLGAHLQPASCDEQAAFVWQRLLERLLGRDQGRDCCYEQGWPWAFLVELPPVVKQRIACEGETGEQWEEDKQEVRLPPQESVIRTQAHEQRRSTPERLFPKSTEMLEAVVRLADGAWHVHQVGGVHRQVPAAGQNESNSACDESNIACDMRSSRDMRNRSDGKEGGHRHLTLVQCLPAVFCDASAMHPPRAPGTLTRGDHILK